MKLVAVGTLNTQFKS